MDSKQQSYNPVSEDLYKKLLGFAEEIADGFSVKLDYSNDSIKKVEEILEKLHDEYKKTTNDEGLRGVALEFAAYIIETIKRNSDGEGMWYEDNSQFGEKSFPFVWKGDTLFPYGWCGKRIFDGKADDVHVKYQAVVLPKLNR